MAVSRSVDVVRLRSLDELDDDDAVILGRVLTKRSPAMMISVLGLSLTAGVALSLFGLPGVLISGALGAVAAGGIGGAAGKHVAAAIQAELGVSRVDADALYLATGNVRFLKLARRPRSDDDFRRAGQLAIEIAKRRAGGPR